MRKLTCNETQFDKSSKADWNLLSNIFKIESKIDINGNKTLMNEAIHEWKQCYPLLRCGIREIDNESYFTFADEFKILNSDHNVDYLYLEPHNLSKDYVDGLIRLLSLRELNIPLDYDNGLLWRITFVHVKCDQSSPFYTYYIIFSTSHLITDGKSIYYSIMQLLRIVDALNSNTYERLRFAAKIDLPDPSAFIKKGPQLPQERYNFPSIPDFLDKKITHVDTKTTENVDIPFERADEIYFYSYHKENFAISLNSLITLSKTSSLKIKTFKFEKERFSRLLAKSKEKNIKLNGCLNIIACLATKMLIDKYSIDKTQFPIVFANALNLRQLEQLGDDLKNNYNIMKCYINGFYKVLDNNFDSNDDKWVEKFWEWAKEDSDELIQRLNSGDLVRKANWNNQEGTMRYHFFLSNLGILPERINDCSFKCSEFYVNSFFADDSSNRLLFLSVCCLNQELLWSVNYVENFINSDLINEFIKNVIHVFDLVIKND